MYDELTQVDIDKMKEEIAYRKTVLRPKLIEDVQTARGFGDLSENFEYKCAKRDKNRNDSRIRYLERMIATARVIDSTGSSGDGIGLFDKVTHVQRKAAKGADHSAWSPPCARIALKGLISEGIPPWARRCWATKRASGWRSPSARR